MEDPERAIVAIKVAARHSEMPGIAPDIELQESFHFKSVTDEVLKLKKPNCASQAEQKTFRLLSWRPELSVLGRFCLLADPRSKVEREN